MFHFTNRLPILLVRLASIATQPKYPVQKPKYPAQKPTRIPMNPANLPFDSETMLQGLRTWVECESPTWDAAAVERMLDIAARDMAMSSMRSTAAASHVGLSHSTQVRSPCSMVSESNGRLAGFIGILVGF